MDQIQQTLLEEIAGLHEVPQGAYNIRANGAMAGRNVTENIDIVTKTDVSGIDIIIKPGTKKESVHIPASIVSLSGKIPRCVMWRSITVRETAGESAL